MLMCSMRPISLSSGSRCHFVSKNCFFSFFFFFKWTHITHSLLPHPPLTRHAIGMKGGTQVEQDGFTSANESSRASSQEPDAYFCLDVRKTTHEGKTSCFFCDILSLPCDPHWQGGLCHTLICNGTNAARDSLLRIPTGTLNSGCTIM